MKIRNYAINSELKKQANFISKYITWDEEENINDKFNIYKFNLNKVPVNIFDKYDTFIAKIFVSLKGGIIKYNKNTDNELNLIYFDLIKVYSEGGDLIILKQFNLSNKYDLDSVFNYSQFEDKFDFLDDTILKYNIIILLKILNKEYDFNEFCINNLNIDEIMNILRIKYIFKLDY